MLKTGPNASLTNAQPVVTTVPTSSTCAVSSNIQKSGIVAKYKEIQKKKSEALIQLPYAGYV